MEKSYISLASAIVKEQESIIGPLAWVEAKKVSGLVIKDHAMKIKSDGKKVLEALVNQYAKLFGRASIEACRDAVKRLVSKMEESEIPNNLL